MNKVFETYEDVFREYGGTEVSAMDVYSDMFSLGKGVIQTENETGAFKPNPIILGSKNKKIVREILFEDTFEKQVQRFQKFDWAITNGITYWGRTNKGEKQAACHALIFDLDDVDPKHLDNFLRGARPLLDGPKEWYPLPNYVVLSGTGVHLYYLFEEPLQLFPNTKSLLKDLKYALIKLIWNKYNTPNKDPQFQGINQGFRLIGSQTKLKDKKTIAYKVREKHFTLAELYSFWLDDKKPELKAAQKQRALSITEAKEKYPEWYERVVLGNRNDKGWVVKEDLYKWWLRTIEEKATYGHRYFAVMCLAIYAVKCGITDRDRILRDAENLIPTFNMRSPREFPFTKDDIKSALECFDIRYKTFPRRDVEKLSAINIPENKRNWQKQKDHLEEARAIRDIRQKRKGTHWWNDEGAPTKQKLIQAYAEKHPDKSQRQIAKATGCSLTTVNKWIKFNSFTE